MARKYFKRIMPHPSRIKDNRYLKMFGSLLHDPGLWHLNRASASGAFAVGLFCAFVPLPFQMLIAAALAIFFRVNLPLSAALVWVTNPLTLAPIFYFAYRVGAWILQWPKSEFAMELSLTWLEQELVHIWQPFLLGCLICGLLSALIGYYAVQWFWRYHVGKSWKARKQRWKEKLLHFEKAPEDPAPDEDLPERKVSEESR